MPNCGATRCTELGIDWPNITSTPWRLNAATMATATDSLAMLELRPLCVVMIPSVPRWRYWPGIQRPTGRGGQPRGALCSRAPACKMLPISSNSRGPAMNILPSLAGQYAIVTGGARGVGLGICRRLEAAGARGAVWDRDLAPLAAIRYTPAFARQVDA